MAEHELIHDYLTTLARRLPPESVEELADGLEETFEHHLSRGLSPAAAASAAIKEFGPVAQVSAAFAHQSVGRRTALVLLATGPVFAVLWGTTLIGARAWTWQIPLGVGIAFGCALIAVAATLMTVARSNDLAATRLTGPAGVVLILLDISMLAAVTIAAPTLTWTVALAGPASLVRILVTARNLPRLFARQ
jgi:hypothetical protein